MNVLGSCHVELSAEALTGTYLLRGLSGKACVNGLVSVVPAMRLVTDHGSPFGTLASFEHRNNSGRLRGNEEQPCNPVSIPDFAGSSRWYLPLRRR